jgi:hypothetical protein
LRNAQKVLVRKPERKRSIDLPVDGTIILKWLLKKNRCYDVDGIDLAKDRDQWRDPVNTIMNLLVP